jgi:hypothetical protein
MPVSLFFLAVRSYQDAATLIRWHVLYALQVGFQTFGWLDALDSADFAKSLLTQDKLSGARIASYG